MWPAMPPQASQRILRREYIRSTVTFNTNHVMSSFKISLLWRRRLKKLQKRFRISTGM